jgi:predicted RNA-binding protein with PUA-like domain
MPKRYWLFKSEPETFSIDDLRQSPSKTASWDGVRNYQARNFLRDDIHKGDEVLFYHSSTKLTGIAGIAVVSRDAHPDQTAFDRKNEYFDPKSDPQKPVWFAVDVRFVKKFRRLIPLAELKSTPGLEKMRVCQKGSRLSIQPVTSGEWKIVLELAKFAEK